MGKSTDSSSEEEEGTMADHSLDSLLPLLVLPLYSLLSTKLQTKVCVVIATQQHFSCFIKLYYRKVLSKCPWPLAAQAPQKSGVGPYTENLLECLNYLLASAHPRLL